MRSYREKFEKALIDRLAEIDAALEVLDVPTCANKGTLYIEPLNEWGPICSIRYDYQDAHTRLIPRNAEEETLPFVQSVAEKNGNVPVHALGHFIELCAEYVQSQWGHD